MHDHLAGPLILGATGKVGTALSWLNLDGFGDVMWQCRDASQATNFAGPLVAWDILQDPMPALRPSAVIALAGVTSGDADGLAQNTALALAACDLATRAGGVRVLLMSSQAVYGPQSGALSEHSPCRPNTPYGQAKLEMEQAVARYPNVTCLRVGNVMGCDAISGAMARGCVTLDRFADGQSPRRAMIGPVTFGHVLQGLLAYPDALPPVLNLAQVGMVAMADVLEAAGVSWIWQDAPPHVLPALDLDVSRLAGLVPLPKGDAVDLVAQARLAGWEVMV